MNIIERKMVAILCDLRDNHGVIGIKAEFEAEGTRFEEGVRLKEVVTRAGLDLCIKIGGCEAIRDMFDARILGASKIVAPMIESEFALKKYVESFEKVFSAEERKDISFAINLETKQCAKNFEEIATSPSFQKIDCVVVGRNDLSYSLGLTREGINHPETMRIATEFMTRSKDSNRNIVCGIGGGVSATSVPLFLQFMPESLSYYETRKVMFDFKKSIGNYEIGIFKALKFEVLWLQNKGNYYSAIAKEDEKRLETLSSRYGSSIDSL
jgi:4-hydroxy-2-oxoheptanedioate aldolase